MLILLLVALMLPMWLMPVKKAPSLLQERMAKFTPCERAAARGICLLENNPRHLQANSRGFFCISCGKHFAWKERGLIVHHCKERDCCACTFCNAKKSCDNSTKL